MSDVSDLEEQFPNMLNLSWKNKTTIYNNEMDFEKCWTEE